MRALTIQDGELHVVERPTPQPGADEVVVAVRAAGINAADLMQRQGQYPAPPGWPDDVPGMELAGVVTAVGGQVSEPLVGRRVCAIVGGGAQATHCALPSEHLLFLPDHVEWEEAGGFAEAFITAYDALVRQARLGAGQRVLISGAAGGVGVAAIQVGRVLGAHVIAVTRTPEHHERLLALGANETITLDEVDSVDGVDVVFELLGAAHLSAAQYRLNQFARVVITGVGTGSRVEVDLRNIMRTRSTLTGATLRSRSKDEKTELIRLVGDALVPRWSKGEIQMPLAKVFELDHASQAYEYFAQPGKLGKVVLRVGE